ncbi:outer membrane protein assembly factor BamE [Roseateles oligotrophus]|uniref:Outer membrane protein assembly factor BamE n=1 Tax=Roseateles oligotrophus TaxID=1769250 RepID=A0ABT2YJN9_9BURK|nr:outer membrane protein assembly factor BamE [Roseateles oligotrophus]MCV2370253.1 outer membrane protein assembly factor BamE [Roseateles oligotrophus]
MSLSVRPASRAIAYALALSLAGCVGVPSSRGVNPGMSSSAVLAQYGPPVQVWPDLDGKGGKTLEYSQQPMGKSALMIRVDAEGKVIGIEDTLQPAVRARIQPGWTPDQVSRLLGKERSRVFFKFSGEDVWDWTVPDEPMGQRQRFNVHFKDGVVLRTTHSMIFDDERMFPMR